ncbi:MAG: GerMN domain-containing protein, partial [Acidimicrobiales bacterium]
DTIERLRPALRELPDPLTITALVNQLARPTTEQEQELGLISIIPGDTTFAADPFSTDLLAELDFVGGTSFDTLEGPQRTLALAQLVWTLTESPSIDRIIIRIDGEDIVWPTGDEDAPIGSQLTREDYARFGPDFVEPTPEPEPEPEQPTEATPTPGS